MNSHQKSKFNHLYDVVVLGGGYSGYAAATRIHSSGLSVLLVDLAGDLLWESGRAFCLDQGSSTSKEWSELLASLHSRGCCTADAIDGASAEIIATHQVVESKLEVLYYVSPVAVETIEGNITSVIVATKSGPRRIAARQWIDATELGLLTRLVCPEAVARLPFRRNIYIYLERNDWPENQAFTWEDTSSGMHASLRTSVWDIERCLHVTLSNAENSAQTACLSALGAAHAQAPDLFSSALVTHLSVEPFPEYQEDDSRAVFGCPANLGIASPSFSSGTVQTLADRFELGIKAAESVAAKGGAKPQTPEFGKAYPAIEPRDTIRTDVAVAGVGTGGALACLAAAKQGVSVIGFDLHSFPGGIGSGGGIHVYYYGVPGGLQNEVDDRIRGIQDLFGSKGQLSGFHPDSKKIVLEMMLEEAGVKFLKKTLIYEVQREEDRIVAVILATPIGPVRLESQSWIDGTGDGDLAALAGASYLHGRAFDGLPHAYSQSSGQADDNAKGLRQMTIVNYDAGWCDPTDPEDLTRARLWGICHYLRSSYSERSRTTYIAPAIGLRQSRQLECDSMLSLGDFIEHRQFPDCIALTAGHYDSHGRDFEFESDEAMFWVWFTRSGFTKSACEISYRMLLPKGLSNVWIASRAAGRTHDGQIPFRMQRDMQRIGEVSGLAAALAAKSGSDSRNIPLDNLRKLLFASGAISVEAASLPSSFRCEEENVFVNEYPFPFAQAEVQEGLRLMEQGTPNAKLWHVYRAGAEVRPHVLKLLSSSDQMVSWLAAGVVALWGDPAAEPRLIEAIKTFEDGFPAEDIIRSNGRGIRPESNHWYQFNWVVAISLLRACGSTQCIDVLGKLAAEPFLPFNLRTAIAVTLGRLVDRNMIEDNSVLKGILQKLASGKMPGRYSTPQRQLSSLYLKWLGQRDQNSFSDPDLQLTPPHLEGTIAEVTGNREDHYWQLHLAICKILQIVGVKASNRVGVHKDDERAFVRKAFAETDDFDLSQAISDIPSRH